MLARLIGYAMLIAWLPLGWAMTLTLPLGWLQALLCCAVGLFALWMSGAFFRQRRMRNALSAAAQGERPAEGHYVALHGVAEAEQQPFATALGGSTALAAESAVRARISRHAGEQERNRGAYRNVFLGLEMVPTQISCEAGKFSLCGFPALRWTDARPGAGPVDPARWESALRGGYRPLRQRQLSQLRCRPRRSVSSYWRFGTLDERERRELREWRIEPGDQVCVLGRLTEQRLEPDWLDPGGIPIHLGDIGAAVREAADWTRITGWSATGLWLALAVLIVWMLS